MRPLKMLERRESEVQVRNVDQVFPVNENIPSIVEYLHRSGGM